MSLINTSQKCVSKCCYVTYLDNECDVVVETRQISTKSMRYLLNRDQKWYAYTSMMQVVLESEDLKTFTFNIYNMN